MNLWTHIVIPAAVIGAAALSWRSMRKRGIKPNLPFWGCVAAGVAIGIATVLLGQKFFGSTSTSDFFWNVKGEMFGGLFTISGLILSVKTYMIMKLKDGVYNTPEYLETYVKAAVKREVTYSCHFEPLRLFSIALSWAIFLTAAGAIFQLVGAAIGKIPGAIIAAGSAGAAIGSLVYCWAAVRSNLKQYFAHLTKANEKNLKAAKEAYAETLAAENSMAQMLEARPPKEK